MCAAALAHVAEFPRFSAPQWWPAITAADLVWPPLLHCLSPTDSLVMSQNIVFKALVFGSVSYYYLQIALLSLYLPVPEKSFQIQPYGGIASLKCVPWNAGYLVCSPRGLAALFLLQPNIKASSWYAWSLKNFPFVPSSGQSGDC